MEKKYSRKLLRKWQTWEQVGIWSDCKWTIRLYDDRIIQRYSAIAWTNNSGSLVHRVRRIDRPFMIRKLKEFAEREKTNNVDYTEKVYEWFESTIYDNCM